MSTNGYIKRAIRVATDMRTVLTDSNGRALTGLITDVSRKGFRVHTQEPLMVGECVSVKVDRLPPFQVQILWANGTEAGAYFLEPVTLI